MSIKMEPSQFVCRYYGGEEQCPFSDAAEKHFWELERKAVETYNPPDEDDTELPQALWHLEKDEKVWNDKFAIALMQSYPPYIPENISAYLCWELDGKPAPDQFRAYFVRPKIGYIKTNDLACTITESDIPTSADGLFGRYYKGEESNPYDDPRHSLWELERYMRSGDIATDIKNKWVRLGPACRNGEFDKQTINGYDNALFCPEVPMGTTKAELLAGAALAMAADGFATLNGYFNPTWEER